MKSIKVLFYSTYKSTFLEDSLLNGFSDVVGRNNTYLYKPKDYKVSEAQVNLTKKKEIITDESILSSLDDFDYVFIFNSAFLDKNLKAVLNKKTSVKKIFIDGIDDFFIRRIYKHPEISYYFKANYTR
jgi:hypothetical protein